MTESNDINKMNPKKYELVQQKSLSLELNDNFKDFDFDTLRALESFNNFMDSHSTTRQSSFSQLLIKCTSKTTATATTTSLDQINTNYNLETVLDLGDINSFTRELQSIFQQENEINACQLLLKNSSINNMLKNDEIDENNLVEEHLPNDAFCGFYNFKIKVHSDCPEGETWIFSDELNKLYIKPGKTFPLYFKTDKIPAKDSIVRFTVVYSKHDQINLNITSCQKHCIGSISHSTHFFHVVDQNVQYHIDSMTQRHSAFIAYDNSSNKSGWTLVALKFVCLNSCLGGNGKTSSPIQLVITLESNDIILARQKIDIKVCTRPVRDEHSERIKHGFTSHETKKVEHTQPTSVKRKYDQIDDNEDTYIIKVKGRKRFEIISRIRDFLEAQEEISVEYPKKLTHLSNTKNESISNSSVFNFLNELKMPSYVQTFIDAGIDSMSKLIKCSKEDIVKLNISHSHTIKIWNNLVKLKHMFNVD